MAMEVQRKQKTLQFDPLVPDILPRVLGMDDKAVAILRRNATKEEGNFGALYEIREAMSMALGAGPVLDDIVSRTVKELQVELDRELPSEPVDMFDWMAHIFTVATAKALYGPQNPLALEPSLEADFWAFDRGLGPLLVGILPSLTARGPYYGRERCVEGFRQYIRDEQRLVQAADIIRKRFGVLHNNGFDLDGQARSELSFLFAGVGNTVITAFWLTLRLFADPNLLADVRKEVAETGVDIVQLRTNAPLLNSALSEALRLASDTNSQRMVLTNTTVQDKETGQTYTLHANSIVQIAAAAMHADPRLWEDALTFNPRRFMSVKAPAGLRPFGGGQTLCPGRNLASGTVLLWTAIIVSSFDISGSGGPLEVPEKEDRKLPVHVCEAKEKVFVHIQKRRN
jgi:cytochrome P450